MALRDGVGRANELGAAAEEFCQRCVLCVAVDVRPSSGGDDERESHNSAPASREAIRFDRWQPAVSSASDDCYRTCRSIADQWGDARFDDNDVPTKVCHDHQPFVVQIVNGTPCNGFAILTNRAATHAETGCRRGQSRTIKVASHRCDSCGCWRCECGGDWLTGRYSSFASPSDVASSRVAHGLRSASPGVSD